VTGDERRGSARRVGRRGAAGGASIHSAREGGDPPRPPERFAALDLGTNNCRLLIAAPRGRKFRVVDAFSRIIRLGEGVSRSGRLQEGAMARALEALELCAEKIEKRGVTRRRLIATQACRAAANGPEFLASVKEKTGLDFEVITPEEEARLSVRGCEELVDDAARAGLVFDIGGGSTEISWVRPAGGRKVAIEAWASLPIGVVNLSEKWNGREISLATYSAIVDSVADEIRGLGDPAALREAFANGHAHLLGTSGTVTSIAGVHLNLDRYRRDAVDGIWLSREDARAVSERLRAMDFDARAAEPCIGVERADLVVCGCAILEALIREWPSARIRVADRGLREGMLGDMADAARRESGRSRRR
jgi:exopolyphosphatase/guanosine-5'-triphosphate,3'-diphosphate pyrophosphatase